MAVMDFLAEETPVTMQIAIHANDGFVLASDIKNLIEGKPASSLEYHSKVTHSSKHGIAISMMGYTSDAEADPAGKLALSLQQCASPTRDMILQWARDYVKAGTEGTVADKFSLLIIHPAGQCDRMWKVFINGDRVTDSPSLLWTALNGNETNPANLWPEFFKCEGNHSLQEATRIAALTILMGGDINPRGVRGLEIWQYVSSWEPVTESELRNLTANYERLKSTLKRFISVG